MNHCLGGFFPPNIVIIKDVLPSLVALSTWLTAKFVTEKLDIFQENSVGTTYLIYLSRSHNVSLGTSPIRRIVSLLTILSAN